MKARKMWSVYCMILPENKAKIAKNAAENGVSASLKLCKRGNAFLYLKESTVCGWVKVYEDGLPSGGSVSAARKAKGRPLLLGKNLEGQAKSFLKDLRSSGGVINTAIMLAAVKGIVLATDANLLAENGGNINLKRDWAKRLLQRMGFVKRRASTKYKVTPAQFSVLKAQLLANIHTVISFEDIPVELIHISINCKCDWRYKRSYIVHCSTVA